MPSPYTGGCQCGQIRYELRAEPLACHCASGSPPAPLACRCPWLAKP
ncbi:MAG: hypothetical protein AAF282_17365 [Cyanobacteria bacterium P01_A01_bin.15]